MSGIYGFWDYSCGIQQENASINRLALWNQAYGNDTEERYTEANISLGCYYEKLSDTAAKSTPVLRKDDKYAVIDAVLYNREELMEQAGLTDELSDEEMLWAYIEKFGLQGLKDINGDFSGAIYNSDEGVLTLFRDHMGVRPLFYYTDEKCVGFSTDIRGLVSMDQVDSALNEKWLWNNIMATAAMGIDNTEFAHIYCVKPASYISFFTDNGKMQQEKKTYWHLGSKKIRFSSEQAYMDRLRELITDSVMRRLAVVSGPVGAELSGGLDSGIIDILIHRLGREAVYFSWSASPQEVPFAENDERYVIEDICKQEHIKCNYGEVSLNFDEESTITKKMKQIGARQDMQEDYLRRYVLPPYINTLAIAASSQFVNQKGAKVVFTGHGGDEGVSHRCNPYELFCHGEYIPYIAYLFSTTQGEKHRIYNTLLSCWRNLKHAKTNLKSAFHSKWEVKELLNNDFYEKYSKEERPPLTFNYDALTYINAGGSRNRLDVVAMLGAYAGARYMVPYLDYRVIDFAVSIPRHMYLKHNRNRYIFREAFKDMIPESLYCLNTKEENSWSNVEMPQKAEAEYINKKQWIADLLDRELWDKYLDWEKIGIWVNQTKAEDERTKGRQMFRALSDCLRIQDVITRSKEVGTQECFARKD